MKCDNCGKTASNAVIFIHIVNNEKNVTRLCNECAMEKGVIGQAGETSTHVSIQKLETAQSRKEIPELSCPVCQLTYESFRTGGLLGCPECYNAFSNQLLELITQAQGTNEHKGKNPSKPREKSISMQDERDLFRLLESLRTAVKNQEFEKAAQLRDEIDQLKYRLT